MARKSLVARQKKREKLVAKYAAKRQALKEQGDYQGLALLPRNSSPVRLHNRGMLGLKILAVILMMPKLALQQVST